MQSAYRDIQYDTLYTLYDVHDVQVPGKKEQGGEKLKKKVYFEPRN